MMAVSARMVPPGTDPARPDPGPARPAGSGDGSGRRDRKKHATRQALRNAALELVAERGFAHVTVEDIAEAADVATRTFFNYFPSKESAVIGNDPERIEQIRLNLLARPPAESPLRALASVLVEYAAGIDEEFDDLGEGREAWFRRLCAVRKDPDLLGAYVGHVADVERSLVQGSGARSLSRAGRGDIAGRGARRRPVLERERRFGLPGPAHPGRARQPLRRPER